MKHARFWLIPRWREAASGLVVAAALLAGCDTPDVNITEPPVHVMNEHPGGGREARRGNTVTIAYTVRLPDGREILSAENYQFQLGRGAVIACVDQTVQGMRAGGRRTIECPPHRHWGRQGYGEIPPNTRLTIDIALVRVR